MRFYYLIILFLLVYAFGLKSQVGVNTKSPQGVFHIDPKGDTAGAINSLDDFIITSEGRVGIGTVSPTASLDVVGDLRIADGTENDRYVMTSDANGIGSWKRQTYTSRVVGNVPATLTSLKSGDNITNPSNWVYTGANITLPAGNWMIYYYCIYNNPNAVNYTVWWDLGTTTNWGTAVRVGRVLSYFAPTTGLSPTYASYGVSPTSTTTYYVLGTVSNPAVAGYTFTYNSGARIWAIPVF
ncbi:hypothetical protein G7051_12575 [Dysgonomonas sp. HDW5B]|uniref:hypothetical protein n=1 Tax=Dysgonomonas sp. HDW5B TaxID=2714927 RepID=UPI00140C3F07|nr:hypothetical protein [Dysgonomonas sp. HDW5B]QIK55130.1 hypothetical protein G7051_12575 [Dysgonomonas sp. HDW5B]